MAQMTDITYGAYSSVAVALQFENGAVGTLLGSYDSSYAYPDSQLVEINGTTGRATVHDTVRRLTSQHGRGGDAPGLGGRLLQRRGAHLRRAPSIATSTTSWSRCGPGRRRPSTRAAGRRALQLALACIESFESGRRTEVPPAAAPEAGRPSPVPPI